MLVFTHTLKLNHKAPSQDLTMKGEIASPFFPCPARKEKEEAGKEESVWEAGRCERSQEQWGKHGNTSTTKS